MNESVEVVLTAPWLPPWLLGLLSTLFLWGRSHTPRSMLYLTCASIMWAGMAIFLNYLHQRFPADLALYGRTFVPPYGSSLALHISMAYAFVSMTLEGVKFYRAQAWYTGMVVTTVCLGIGLIFAGIMDLNVPASLLYLAGSLLTSVIAASLVFRVRPIYRWLYDVITEWKRSRRSLRSLVPSIMKR